MLYIQTVTEAQRQEYAAYTWRLERENKPGMPKNFRTSLDDFQQRDPISGYDPDYVPSRKGLDLLRMSASSDFSDAQLDALVEEIRKMDVILFFFIL